MFVLVVLLLHGHVWGSIRVHLLWVRPCFSISVLHVWFVGCTTWTLTKQLEKKLDGNYTRMLCAILNKSWRQHPTRHQLYGHHIYIYIYIYIYMCVCVCVCAYVCIYICIYAYIHQPIGIMVRAGRVEFNPKSSNTKDQKNCNCCYLDYLSALLGMYQG